MSKSLYVIRSIFVGSFLLLFVSACGGGGGGQVTEETKVPDEPPFELVIEVPEDFVCSVAEDALTVEQVLEWLDIRISEWIVQNIGEQAQNAEDLLEFIDDLTIVIHDDYAFPCGEGNETSFCGDYTEVTEDGGIRLHTSIYLDDHAFVPPRISQFNVVCVRHTDEILELTNNEIWADKDCSYWGFIPFNEDDERIGFPTLGEELSRLILGSEEPRRVIEPEICERGPRDGAGPTGGPTGDTDPTPDPTPPLECGSTGRLSSCPSCGSGRVLIIHFNQGSSPDETSADCVSIESAICHSSHSNDVCG